MVLLAGLLKVPGHELSGGLGRRLRWHAHCGAAQSCSWLLVSRTRPDDCLLPRRAIPT